MLVESKAPVRVDFAGAWTDVQPFFSAFGGATLNAAIALYVRGRLATESHAEGEAQLQVQYETDVPAGSGLGTSAAMNVVWLSLARGTPLRNLKDREELAESAYRIERVLGIIGGKQDQYASAVGGINLFEFHPDDTVTTNPIRLPSEAVSELESLFLLIYTGRSRLSSRIHEHVWGGFREGKREVVDALLTMRDSAYEAREALLNGNWERLGKILTLQFECAKRLHPTTTSPDIERLFEALSDLSLGGKPCGAGGGGCVLFLCKSKEAKAEGKRRASKMGFKPYPFKFDFEGLTVRVEE
ncbi:MAG TPA: hypothetical protein EYP65_05475 [Armatimonadetes bacterium]|nr:hypothetical protein [Armatimonadota bacterium]